ncbi:MAG: pyruvate dehydrogenase E2 component (dihydrolipoamide acetyltransferase) [Chitinophagales bacterium]|jgi:pyruvate dehydrogenase E2 component (dihydrolipoamide acetyltransferase)
MAEALRLPRMSDTMEEGVIAEIMIKVGDTIETGDVIAEVETDKATMEWESFQEGKVIHVAVASGDTIAINGVVAILGEEGEDFQHLLIEETEDEEPAVETSKEDDTDNTVEFNVSDETKTTHDDRIKASPLAKKIAKDKGVDIQQISGSGEEGRIVKKDVEAFMSSGASTQAASPSENITKEKASPSPTPPVQLPTIVAEESYTEERVSQMRKTIARRLSESKFQAPHFYLTIEVNMNNTIAARKQINAIAPVKISFNDIVIKATAAALRKNPAVNASWLGDKIRYNNHIHIGMAVAVPEGLMVPVIKFADNKSLSHISAESKQLAEKAKTKKITPEEMQGNTFSISNLGGFGITEFTAVINPPDACILAVGGIKKELGYNDRKEIIENNIMKLTLSCDHRVVDGAVGTHFLLDLKNNLENPVMMLV